MRKIVKMLFIVSIASVLVLGCSQGDAPPAPPSQADQPTADSSPAKKDVSKLEKEITVKYELEGMEEVKKASLYVSSNQPFYTYVIEGFEATPAEPGLDQIFYQMSPDNSMNVEVYEKDVSLEYIESNVVETLKSIGEPKELDAKEAFGGIMADAEAYWSVSDNHGSIAIVIAKIDGVYVKFTIHTVEEWESIMPFLVMMEKMGLQ